MSRAHPLFCFCLSAQRLQPPAQVPVTVHAVVAVPPASITVVATSINAYVGRSAAAPTHPTFTDVPTLP